MSPFTQCAACSREYADPGDRRFHSQTNSCADCGPRLLCQAIGGDVRGDPLEAAIEGLRAGRVVALQGMGGFHLAVDPRHRAGVARLRREKARERKPFALMVRDLPEARALCVLSEAEEHALVSPHAPIVIARRRAEAPRWLDAVSDTDTLGIMLPSTPLHVLLFRHPRAGIDYGHLVMTSGNRANEPIITTPDEAIAKLAGAAELFLIHDRNIVFRADDSIVRVPQSSPPYLLRRSRGLVPRLINLARPVKGTVLALGGDLKNAPALAQGGDLHLAAYNGDLDDAETMRQFDAQVRQLLELYAVSPDVVMRDMHPAYRSSRWAPPPGVPVVSVQHHHAHALSVMAEHGLEETLALSFDGTGYGTDGTIWGGEFLHATRGAFRRLGSFSPFPLPGGDAATLRPPRIAFALLDGQEGADIPRMPPVTPRCCAPCCGPACTARSRAPLAASSMLPRQYWVSWKAQATKGKAPYAWRARDFAPPRAGTEARSPGRRHLPCFRSRPDRETIVFFSSTRVPCSAACCARDRPVTCTPCPFCSMRASRRHPPKGRDECAMQRALPPLRFAAGCSRISSSATCWSPS